MSEELSAEKAKCMLDGYRWTAMSMKFVWKVENETHKTRFDSWYLLLFSSIRLNRGDYAIQIFIFTCPVESRSVLSSSCRAASTDLPPPLSPPIYIVHRSWEFFKAISCIGTYIGSSWSSCLCSSMWRGLWEFVAYEFVLTSLAVSGMSGSYNLDSFRDRW